MFKKNLLNVISLLIGEMVITASRRHGVRVRKIC